MIIVDKIFEKYKDLNLDFEQDHFSRTAKSFQNTAAESIRSMKMLAFDRFYGKIKYFASMGCVLLALKQVLEFYILCENQG